jgi:hypothetical protein
MDEQPQKPKSKRSKRKPKPDTPDEAYRRYLADLVDELKANDGQLDPQHIVPPSEEIKLEMIRHYNAMVEIALREKRSLSPRVGDPDAEPDNLLGKGIFPEDVEEAIRLAGIVYLSVIRSSAEDSPPFFVSMPAPKKQISLEFYLDSYYFHLGYSVPKEVIRKQAETGLREEKVPPLPESYRKRYHRPSK